MTTAANKEIIRELFEVATREAFAARLADDVVWTVMGSTSLSGSVIGKANVIDVLAPRVASRLEQPTRIQLRNIVAEGDHVVVECSGTSRTIDGHDYDNDYCEVFRLQDGLIREVRIYLDTALVNKTIAR